MAGLSLSLSLSCLHPRAVFLFRINDSKLSQRLSSSHIHRCGIQRWDESPPMVLMVIARDSTILIAVGAASNGKDDPIVHLLRTSKSKIYGANISLNCNTSTNLILPCSFLRRLKQTFDINTNVKNDVILFKYESPRFYKILNAFSICQFLFWSYLANFAYTTLRDAPVPQESEVPWWRKINLGENKYRNTITIFSFGVGYLILVSSWIYTLKSVRFLILRKGGTSVTFVTYGPFGKNRMCTIPLRDVSCKEARQNARVQLPIKVRGHWFHYMLDMRGEFTNAKLFDHTAGLRRNFPI
ncbi:hypothetical protein B566_EDAN001921 [Ephemera danica]|nr:hypothetical protein B566_EDAN001921 [Ephemera danica]